MDTTYTQVSTEKKEAKPVSTEGFISKKALITFVAGAAIVFSCAVYYCISTNHGEVGAALVGAFGLISILAFSMYKSFK